MATAMSVDDESEDDEPTIITQQTICDLGTWLSEKQQYTHAQLARLQHEEHYLSLVALANNYWLTGALTYSLKKSSVWSLLPATLKDYLTEIERFYYQRSEAIQQEAILSCSLLLDTNIKVILIKGAANLFNGVAKPISSRYMSDIDVLVLESKLDECVSTLEKSGYFKQNDNEELLIEENAHHHAPPLIRKNGICYIELHRWALPLSSHLILQTREIWQHCIPLTLAPGLEVLQLHPTQQIILAIAHSEISNSAYTENHIDLRQLFNLYNLTTHFDLKINWLTVEEHFQRANLSDVLNAILFSTYQIFGLITPLTKTDDISAQNHFSKGLELFIKTQGDDPKFSYSRKLIRGYRRKNIIDLYGKNGKFPLLSGRIKHLKRHIQMLFMPIFLTRFIKRNFNKY
jgi:hypothetical protein